MANQVHLESAWIMAKRSRDLSTQNGAILVSLDGISVPGWNDFPHGVLEADGRRDRPVKYEYTEHAERAAIFLAAREGVRCDGATLYCLWAACADCTRAIICAGISRLVTCRWPAVRSAHWSETVGVGERMFAEAGVEVIYHDFPVNDGETLRFMGEDVLY